ncbi:hypothetical protein AAG570_000053 [Ranatra chinensis]|uniref:Reverse transcriptase/retrotransposon-derived protein RNase H-like domain-containing protein n=1 Tax=Ranatra chinensis TaxID=642074 RepID=A0ABD0YWL2_9HEMI
MESQMSSQGPPQMTVDVIKVSGLAMTAILDMPEFTGDPERLTDFLEAASAAGAHLRSANTLLPPEVVNNIYGILIKKISHQARAECGITGSIDAAMVGRLLNERYGGAWRTPARSAVKSLCIKRAYGETPSAFMHRVDQAFRLVKARMAAVETAEMATVKLAVIEELLRAGKASASIEGPGWRRLWRPPRPSERTGEHLPGGLDGELHLKVRLFVGRGPACAPATDAAEEPEDSSARLRGYQVPKLGLQSAGRHGVHQHPDKDGGAAVIKEQGIITRANVRGRFEEVFYQEGKPLSATGRVRHEIVIPDNRVVYFKPRRYPQALTEVMEEEVRSLLSPGIVRKSVSPRFLPSLADRMEGWNSLTKKGAKLVITEDLSEVLKWAKTQLCEDPVFRFPDFPLPFAMGKDASQVAVGAVLSQVDSGVDRLVAYARRDNVVADCPCRMVNAIDSPSPTLDVHKEMTWDPENFDLSVLGAPEGESLEPPGLGLLRRRVEEGPDLPAIPDAAWHIIPVSRPESERGSAERRELL